MTDILTGTPPELTYLHPLVREAWTVVWAVASGVLVLILGCSTKDERLRDASAEGFRGPRHRGLPPVIQTGGQR